MGSPLTRYKQECDALNYTYIEHPVVDKSCVSLTSGTGFEAACSVKPRSPRLESVYEIDHPTVALKVALAETFLIASCGRRPRRLLVIYTRR
jgi:hypothetical protein